MYLNHACQAGDVDGLAHVPVLEQALLGHVRLLEVHAQIEVLEHDLFDELLRDGVVSPLGLDDLVEGVEGPLWLA